MLQQLPTIEDFPDTLYTAESRVRTPIKQSSPILAIQPSRLCQSPEPHTPQKKTSTFRRLEGNHKEASQSAATDINMLHDKNLAINKQANRMRQTATCTQHDKPKRVPDVCEGHSSNKSTNHDHAKPVNDPDGRNTTQPVHSQHNEGNISEHERHHYEVRVMHWNAQGLNNSANSPH